MSWDSRINKGIRRPPPPPSPERDSTARTAAKPAPHRDSSQSVDGFASAKTKSGPNLLGTSVPIGFGWEIPQSSSSSGSVNVGSDGVTVSTNSSVELKGLKISFGTKVSQTSSVESEDGVTTLTAEGSMSVNLGGEVDLGTVGFSAERTEGVKTKFQVRMSDADYAQVQSGQAPMPDPYNPDTMPEGSSVLLNSTDFQGTGFEASYRNLAVSTNVTQEQGVSVLVEKTGENTVRVTAGPTEAVENSFQLGLSLGPASAHVGNTTRLDQFTLKTAEFDLSTDAGRAAYNTFLATGELPTENGTGISDVATVEKLQYDSTSSAGFDLGPLSGSVDFGNSTGGVVRTTYPDGSVDQVIHAKLHVGTPVQLAQHFNLDGTEDLSRQEISMFMVGADGGAESLFASAYDVDQHDFDGDSDIHLSFNAEQAMDLSQRARDYIAAWERDTGQKWEDASHLQDEKLIAALANAQNPADVAKALTDAYGGPAWMGQAFASLSFVDGEFVPLPGTIEARDRDD
ncbi:hypothetical protein LXT21_25005 [Myxococcus sp. K38C18041901]|uniref:hypothetical protein n=1 Tax=Myxococcus guangdongensis TaxID=2906760 RepID=UPI0020A7EF1F|nr:hypothetical protein [Myxococcus guangdongensis]MCP3062049.1 hypothetical protein [Myxococcus guangdongensis]